MTGHSSVHFASTVHHGGTTEVFLSGALNHRNAGALTVAISRAMAASPVVVLDLADVPSIDDASVNVIAAAVARCRGDRSVNLRNPQWAVLDLLEANQLRHLVRPG